MPASRSQPLGDADDRLGPGGGLPEQDCVSEPAAAAALGQWAGSIRPRLVGLARRFLRSDHDAEEVAQDALLLACRQAGRLQDIGQRNAWAWRATINLSLNRLRRRQRNDLQLSDGCPTAQADTGQRMELVQLAERVRAVISELPDRQQAALVLRELEQLSYDQIAGILQARPAAVRLLVHRAREKVRETLLQRWPDSFE